jgi:antitoxin component of MazEF toxin-antitoxin module
VDAYAEEGDQVPIYRQDGQSIVKPVKRRDLLEVLGELQPLAEGDLFPEVDDTLLPRPASQFVTW